LGAVRLEGWVTLGTKWQSVRADDFIAWVRERLAPRLRAGDIVLLDNLPAHTAPAARALIEARRATVKVLPPYSPDFNPIEAVWALVKKYIRAFAPRTADGLRRIARAARHAVSPYHCSNSSPMPGTSPQLTRGLGYGGSIVQIGSHCKLLIVSICAVVRHWTISATVQMGLRTRKGMKLVNETIFDPGSSVRRHDGG
jgi:transposase